MKNIKLHSTDYVILDRANNRMLMFGGDDTTVIFGDKYEAQANCYGNEEVIACTDLPEDLKAQLINEIESFTI